MPCPFESVRSRMSRRMSSAAVPAQGKGLGMTDARPRTDLLFYAAVLLYAMIFLLAPALGPTDDFVFLRTLQSGKPLIYISENFPYYDWKGFGRFSPLTSWEYNIFLLFFASPAASWYFAIHALQFIIFSLIFAKILTLVPVPKFLAYGTTFLLILHPAFSISWFRLQLPERNVAFFFAIFLIFLIKNDERPRLLTSLLCLLAANFAIYYKEVAFAPLAALAISRLVWVGGRRKRGLVILDILVLASAVLYLTIYLIFVFPNSHPAVLNHRENILGEWVRTVLNYGLYSDPLLVFIATPLFLQRLWTRFFNHKEWHPLYDPMLAGGVSYFSCFVVMNLSTPYYLLPAYIFALPASLYFLRTGNLKAGRAWAGLRVLTVAILLLNTLPAGIHYLTYNKYLPYNFDSTLNFLGQDLRSRQRDQKPSIFMEGVDLSGGRGSYFILAEFLHSRGLNADIVDLKCNTPTEKPIQVVSKISFPHTVFSSDFPAKIQKGDYLLITPQRTHGAGDERLRELMKSPEYEAVFSAKGAFDVPNISAKVQWKAFALRFIPTLRQFAKSEATWERTDYYVLLKK